MPKSVNTGVNTALFKSQKSRLFPKPHTVLQYSRPGSKNSHRILWGEGGRVVEAIERYWCLNVNVYLPSASFSFTYWNNLGHNHNDAPCIIYYINFLLLLENSATNVSISSELQPFISFNCEIYLCRGALIIIRYSSEREDWAPIWSGRGHMDKHTYLYYVKV